MKKFTKLLALLLALSMIFSVLSACSSKDDSDTTPSGDTQTPAGDSAQTPSGDDAQAPTGDGTQTAVDHTLIVGTTIANDTFDPLAEVNYELQHRMIYEALVDVDADGQIVPLLASSLEYTDDYTLKITVRDDVYFTNGQKLTANDVLESYKLWDEKHRYNNFWDIFDWDKCYVEDDQTLYFGFNTVYGAAISYMVCWPIFCAEDIANNTADDWTNSPNGTSPYYLTENVPASTISYQRKDAANYWGDLPECESVTFKYYSDTTTLYIDFESGNLDAAYGINAQDGERVMAGDCPDFLGYSVVSQKDVLRIQLCETTEVFQDPAVREAFSLALDVNGMATANYGSIWLPATSTVASTVQYYTNCGEHEYDPEKAKQVLADAGYSEGDITVRVVCTVDNQDLAATMQAYLAAVGINLNVETYDLGVLIGMWRDGESDVLVQQTIGGAFFSDPVIVYANNSPEGSTRIMAITDPTWVEAFNKSCFTTDEATRAEGYAAMQQFCADEYFLIPVCETADVLVWNTDKVASYGIRIPGNPSIYDVTFVG